MPIPHQRTGAAEPAPGSMAIDSDAFEPGQAR